MRVQKAFRGMRSRFRLLIFAIGFSCIATAALAYKLQPKGSDGEKRIVELEEGFFGAFKFTLANWLNDYFSTPVHEEITNLTWGCQSNGRDDKRCTDWNGDPKIAPVVYGVQWNDNPPFAITQTSSPKFCAVNRTIRLPDLQPECWSLLYYDAEKNARGAVPYDRRSGKALIYRVHFGDMQFLHSMASWDGERMRDTKQNIMMWAEFAYKTALGDIETTTEVQRVPVDGFNILFRGNGYDVSSLFTRGLPAHRGNIPLVAFGSLLHMIQDSFSESHVTRAPASGECGVLPGTRKAGRVLEFHSFNRQDFDKHGHRDSRDSHLASMLKNEVNAVTVGRTLKTYLEAKAPWDTVSRYLDECVYAYDAENDWDKPAGPGVNFIRTD